MRLLVVALLSILFGYSLGCVSWLQGYLHFTLWFIIPMSGIMFGMTVGSLQFALSYLFSLRISFFTSLILAFFAGAGYFATDFGIYSTAKIPVGESNMIMMKLRNMVSFQDYMSYRLGDTTAENFRTHATYQVGATANKLNYILGLCAASIASLGAIGVLLANYPQCSSCGVYTRRKYLYKIAPSLSENGFNELFDSIASMMQNKKHGLLVRLLSSLEKNEQNPYPTIKIVADHRECPKCQESIILGKVLQKSEDNEKDWKVIPELSFKTNSSEITT
jgi:hypothetical protein